jgi:hypothetical protein
MKNTYLLILVLFVSLVSEVNSQVSNIPTLSNEVLREKKYTDIEGSAYLYNDWKPGSVIDHSGKSYNNVQIKYDAHKDLVELNQDGKVMILNKSIYKKFVLEFVEGGSNNIVKHEFSSEFKGVEGEKSNQYFEVMLSGDISLIKKYDVKFINEVVNNYGTAAEIKRFQRKEIFYLVYAEKASEIKMSTKSILSLELLPQDFKNFLTDKKVKIKNEEDLITTLKLFRN